MLEYNPFFRQSAKECLQNPIFDEIRVPALERNAPEHIVVDIDEVLPIDYDNGRIRDTDKSPEMISNIIKYFKIEILNEMAILRKMHSERWAKTPFHSCSLYGKLILFLFFFDKIFVWQSVISIFSLNLFF